MRSPDATLAASLAAGLGPAAHGNDDGWRLEAPDSGHDDTGPRFANAGSELGTVGAAGNPHGAAELPTMSEVNSHAGCPDVNPATGLPMIDGACVETMGNPFGVDLSEESPDSAAVGFDNTWNSASSSDNSGSASDDSWSSSSNSDDSWPYTNLARKPYALGWSYLRSHLLAHCPESPGVTETRDLGPCRSPVASNAAKRLRQVQHPAANKPGPTAIFP